MWLSFPAFTALLFLLMDSYESTRVDNELELVFMQRFPKTENIQADPCEITKFIFIPKEKRSDCNVNTTANNGHNIGKRSHSDWRDVWHREKYVRCREALKEHLVWACKNDIYRISRRGPSKRFEHFLNGEVKYPWISERNAKIFLRTRRGVNRRQGSITSECCKSSGCTWEEYAEYCPIHKRYSSYV